MGNFELVRYNGSDADSWNAFVDNSRNATFLFNRGYMDYHSDRFHDNSLIFLKNGSPAALLPANLDSDGCLHSHQGLTYGGLLLPRRHVNGSDILEMFGMIDGYCRKDGIKSLIYKPLPFIYAQIPSQEDIYALFRHGAVISRTELSSAIYLKRNPGFNTQMRRHLKKALALNPDLKEDSDVGPFWDMLSACLQQRHEAMPVHSRDELQMLRDRFPQNIRVFTISTGSGPEAGVCIYDTGIVAHCQYIATTPSGREKNLLTPLFDYLINDIFAERSYFDFGTSNEDAGNYLNDGLLRQKFSYGATGVACQHYRITYRQ